MEVASPLQFTPSQAGTKRAFPCSPGLVESTTAAVGMELTEDYAQQSFKRRRFNDHADSSLETTPHAVNPFATMATTMSSALSNGAFSIVDQRHGRDPVKCDILCDVIMT